MVFDGLPVFVVDHLKRIAKKEGFVDGFEVKHESGSNVGDGFMATMLSIKLIGYRRQAPSGDLELDELALICKLQPSNVARQENFSSDRLFRREVFTYTTILPVLMGFQEQHGVPEDQAFAGFPNCFAAFHEDGSDESVIILEDLRAAGFSMWNRKKPMDLKAVSLLMEQIGRLHGLSLAFRDQNPEMFKIFQDLPPIMVEISLKPGLAAMVQMNFTKIISLMDNDEDVESLEQLSKIWKQVFKAETNAKLIGQHGVVSHGDCWINNTMFIMDEGSAKTISMVDWQMSRVTSPAVDFSYFLFTSTVKSLRDKHLDEFIRIYYTNLAQTIRSNFSDPDVLFPEAELHRQLQKFGVYGVMLAPIIIPNAIADTKEISNLDEMAETLANGTEDTGTMTNLSEESAKEYAQRVKDVLADARQYGWIN